MNDKPLIRLHGDMAVMVALEHTIEQRIKDLVDKVAHNSEVAALLKDLHEVTAAHQRTLTTRLRTVAPDVSIPDVLAMTSPVEGDYDKVKYPVSDGLVSLHTLFDQAVIGYAVLMVLANRTADSGVRWAENTYDIVEQHMHESTAAVQRILRLLPSMVVSELEEEGQECQCTCPSCGFGICLCAVAPRRMMEMARAEAGPIYVPEGIVMVRPRSGSAADQAGLRKGDIVLAVDDKDIESLPMLQETIHNHKSGEEIRFRAQRESGQQMQISAIRP